MLYLGCDLPDEHDIDHGFHCKGQCLDNNQQHVTLEGAWKRCGEVLGCEVVMRNSVGAFYLRRLSDLTKEGEGIWGYTFKECGKCALKVFELNVRT